MFSRVLSKKILSGNTLKAGLHMTPVAMARWGGQKASESRPRELSRKQKKRKKTAIELKESKVDKAKTKLKDNFIQDQMKTPEFEKLLTDENLDLNAAIRRMMLPNDVSVPALDGGTPNGQPPIKAHGILNALQSGIDASSEQQDNDELEAGGSYLADISEQVSKKDANNALKTLCSIKDIDNAERMLQCMVKARIPIQHSSIVDVMTLYNKSRQHDKCINMFNKLESTYGMPHPTPPAWGCFIEAKTDGGLGNVDEAIRLLKHLEKSGVVLLCTMYNPILRALIKGKRHDETFDTWVDMKLKGVNPNVESYDIMVEQCEFLGQPERAFFLIDEMKLADLTPNKKTYCKLIRACSTAPMWVNGYQDIVFDALAKLEGQELMPDVTVYNSIIFAFSRVGDGAAADFYLQEMKRKNLSPTTTSYNHVFHAYANNQLVGAKYYGKLGRYVRPEPAPDTERQALYKAAGFDVVNDELSKTFIKPDAPERGKRQKTQYEDMYEFDEEAQEDFDNNLRVEVEAKKMALQREQAEWEAKVKKLNAGKTPGKALQKAVSSNKALSSGAVNDDDDSYELESGLDSYEDMMDPNGPYAKLLAGGGGEEDSEEYKTMLQNSMIASSKDAPGTEGAAAYEKMIHQLQNGGDDIDPSSFLSPEDKKEWESFMGGYETLSEKRARKNKDAAANGADEITSGAEKDDDVFDMGDFDIGDKDTDLAPTNASSTTTDGDDDEIDGLEGMDIDDEMMGKLNTMIANMESEKEGTEPAETMSFVTSQSTDLEGHSTTDAFNTLNTLLGYLDDGGGVARKEHYVNNNKSISGGELGIDEDGLVATQEVDRLWDLVEFGRAPNPDYSETLRHRRAVNIARCMHLYEEMCYSENLRPNQQTLSNLVAVVGHATLHLKAEELVEKFAVDHNISPNHAVYDAIIKMHVLRRDIDSALNAKNKMIELNMTPSRESYGLLIMSLSTRKMLEEALLTLEDAADRQIQVKEIFLRKLRYQCSSVGIIHPDLPADPMEWVNAVKDTRRKNKGKSKRNVQPVQSAMYNS